MMNKLFTAAISFLLVSIYFFYLNFILFICIFFYPSIYWKSKLTLVVVGWVRRLKKVFKKLHNKSNNLHRKKTNISESRKNDFFWISRWLWFPLVEKLWLDGACLSNVARAVCGIDLHEEKRRSHVNYPLFLEALLYLRKCYSIKEKNRYIQIYS